MIALAGTAASTVLLVGAKAGFSSPQASDASHASPAAPGGLPPGNGTTPGPGAGGPGGPGAGGSGGPVGAGAGGPGAGGPRSAGAGATPGSTGTKTTAAPPPKATTGPPKPPRTTMKDGTFNGNPIYVEYGNIELQMIVSGGKITDIKVLDSPSDHSRSVSINNSALPKLRAEALSAQSANIDTISGATYSSSGYKLSLQSAIDRAYQA